MTTETEFVPSAEVFRRVREGDIEFVRQVFTDRPDLVNLKNLAADLPGSREWDERSPLPTAALGVGASSRNRPHAGRRPPITLQIPPNGRKR